MERKVEVELTMIGGEPPYKISYDGYNFSDNTSGTENVFISPGDTIAIAIDSRNCKREKSISNSISPLPLVLNTIIEKPKCYKENIDMSIRYKRRYHLLINTLLMMLYIIIIH